MAISMLVPYWPTVRKSSPDDVFTVIDHTLFVLLLQLSIIENKERQTQIEGEVHRVKPFTGISVTR